MAASERNGPSSSSTTAEGARFFKFSFLMAKKTDGEQTEMTEDFRKDCQHYTTYDEAVTKLVAQLEACYLPGRDPNIFDKDEPLYKLSMALHDYKKYFHGEVQTSLERRASNISQAVKIKRICQKDQRYTLRHLRRFPVDDYPKFCAQKKAFDTARERMDNAKMEIRQAKTTAQIEKKAVCYQMAVDDFDVQTEGVIKWFDALPKLKAAHNNDIIQLLGKHCIYHRHMHAYYK
ncbi:unnamed protein product [Caenorhabditis auriculariae]|uniref:BAR domain-containing protein n=1 Tax=Caenorhabditis auriculariae TaxID=2777116 RepID=A0A8S1H2X4_9PELO|nr:unnamed protein product [Caenorhabditis auriculariae]